MFLSHSTVAFRRWTVLCCGSELFRWWKCLWARGRGDYQLFASKNFCLTVTENFVEETFCVSGNEIPAPKIVKDKRGCGYHDFPSNLFILTVTKHFVKKPFCAVFQKYSTGGKVFEKEGGGETINNSRRIFFVSKCRKVCLGNLLCFRIFPAPKIVRDKRGCGYQVFPSNFFVSQFRDIS